MPTYNNILVPVIFEEDAHSAAAPKIALEILEDGGTHASDCIIISSHKPGFEDYFIGSIAARVVRQAKCGVHILR
ncbi:MAG: universal stress protein [Roseobacter sp.]